VTNFVLNYLPSTSSYATSTPPVHLPRVSESVAEVRQSEGIVDRELVAIGHSFGGCSAALAAANEPKLFRSIVFVDPVIVPPDVDRNVSIRKLVLGAVQRRETWPSRDEAKRLFLTSPFFSAWDPAVLNVYVEAGLTTLKHSAEVTFREGRHDVCLKTPAIQEAIVFPENRASREAFEVLKTLDHEVELRWIMAGVGEPIAYCDEKVSEVVWTRPTNSSNTKIDCSHLIPQEAPKELALQILVFLRRKVGAATVDRARL